MAEMSLADLARVYSAGPQVDPQSLAALGSQFNQPFGELSASPRPSPTQWLGNKTQDLMESAGASPYVARHLTEGLSGILGFTPLGLLGSAANAVDANARNDNAGTLQAMAGMIPGVGPIERKVAAEAGPMIRAYHGSPHDFDKFSLEKIGTGEGAQAFGHGLYFAENEGVAKSYRDALADSDLLVGGKSYNPSDPEHFAAATLAEYGSPEDAIRNLKASIAQDSKINADWAKQSVAQKKDVINRITRGGLPGTQEIPHGKMYEVGINANPDHFLDWDKPLSDQHPVVQDFVRSLETSAPASDLPSNFIKASDHSSFAKPVAESLASDPRWKGVWDEDRVWKHINEKYPDFSDASKQQIADEIQVTSGGKSGSAFSIPPTVTGQQLLDLVGNKLYVHPSDVSQKMADAGIPGIKYLDQGSRGSGEGSRNYVVFNDRLIDIVKKYAVAGIALPPAIAAQYEQMKQSGAVQ
jgi:hypothetical protein